MIETDKKVQLSVIIPTCNRKDVLVKCLQALFRQTCPTEQFEIIIVNDGSKDDTKGVVSKLMADAPAKLHYYEQSNRGPAAARNVGVRQASGELVLFIGDDIIAHANLLQEHIDWHTRFPEEHTAILGHVTWSPELRVTPFMRWLENGGPQFAYNEIKSESVDHYGFFWTCNISLKREFMLSKGLFDEGFPYAAYEDIELGYRLALEGLKIKYNRKAAACHLHPGINVKNYKKRMEVVGESEVIFSNKYPGLSLSYQEYRKMADEKCPSLLWLVLYEIIDKLRIARFIDNVAWHAKKYYFYQLSKSFLAGYHRKKDAQAERDLL
jgi:glycosyltransferase involved in cell wall biosynthesis